MKKISLMKKVLMEMNQVTHEIFLFKISYSFTFIYTVCIPEAAKIKNIGKESNKDEYGALDFRNLTLKPDHSSRPLWMV